MSENTILIFFLLAPLAVGSGMWAFFRQTRRWQSPRQQAARLILGNTLVLLFCVSWVLPAGECYYRYVYDEPDTFSLSKVSQRWFTRYYQFNAASVRDSLPAYERKPPEGKRRVTFIGDSFTAGHGVEDVEQRFANLIRHRHPEWEIHVLADNGNDTGQELLSTSEIASIRYVFDTVVLVYCLNDLSDLLPEWKAILDRVYRTKPPGALVENSYLLNTLYYRWKATRHPEVRSYYQLLAQAYEGPVWQQQARRLAQYRQLINATGGRLLVVTFPFLSDLGPDYPFRQAHGQLGALWNHLQVPHLDLLPLYEPNAGPNLVVNAYDAHPSIAAHAMAADAIEVFIKTNMTARPPAILPPVKAR